MFQIHFRNTETIILNLENHIFACRQIATASVISFHRFVVGRDMDSSSFADCLHGVYHQIHH